MTTSHAGNTQQTTISVYPNPFQDEIKVDGLTGDESFRMSAVSGRVIAAGDRLDMLNVKELKSGIYFLFVQQRSEQQVFKILTNNPLQQLVQYEIKLTLI